MIRGHDDHGALGDVVLDLAQEPVGVSQRLKVLRVVTVMGVLVRITQAEESKPRQALVEEAQSHTRRERVGAIVVDARPRRCLPSRFERGVIQAMRATHPVPTDAQDGVR